MLKQRIENKGETKPYVSPYTDKPIRREDVEDSERPGHARASLFPAPPDVWNALGYYRLLANGKQTWPVAQSVDPSHVSRSEAPASLLRAVDEAQAALDSHRGKVRECHDRIYAAEVKLKQAARDQNKQVYNETLVVGMAAEEQLRALLMEEPPFVKRLADAERAVKFWMDDERMYRSGLVPRPEPTANVF